ncbi:hypothetical protein FRC17_007917 [Serendipita sp. 399]|nr:hypothetical protein FRC17_007917 [Serendipita sp. 399]
MTGSVGGNGLGLGTSTKGGEGGGSESKSKSKAAILEKRAHIEDAKAKLLIAKDIMRALGKRPRTPEPCSPIKKQWTKALTTALSPIKGRMANTFGTSKKKPKPSLTEELDFSN